METIGVRELQQHASKALRRVEQGETLGVTDRGRLVAVLAPPPALRGTQALVAAGRVTPAARPTPDLPLPVQLPVGAPSIAEVLDELRAG